jgi:oxygen-independent coproporphyrinogen III oxidase
MARPLFGTAPRVARMHWGGGTPTYYEVDRLRRLFGTIGRHFELAHDGDYSIEVDPRTVDAEAIEALRAVGFNRVSFGVQDFDPAVQAAVHRVQSRERTLSVIDAAHRCRFDSVNIDLIYGLPLQTPASFERTLELVVAARPARIALYNYAHLPERFKAQRRIRAGDLPSAGARLEILGLAVERLGAAGYRYIGMDHFALPDDPLAAAQRHGRLRRDFQGYSSGSPCDLVGLGVSAIGAVGATYSQNHRELEGYYACLARGSLPIKHGLHLTADDLVRRAVIEGLMCNFALSKGSIETAYVIEFDRYFAPELRALHELQDMGLVSCEGDWINVAPKGRFVVRGICMMFDRYLRRDGAGSPRFSRVI